MTLVGTPSPDEVVMHYVSLARSVRGSKAVQTVKAILQPNPIRAMKIIYASENSMMSNTTTRPK